VERAHDKAVRRPRREMLNESAGPRRAGLRRIAGLPSSPDPPLEGTGFEPPVPREAAGIRIISVLVRADFSACRESTR